MSCVDEFAPDGSKPPRECQPATGGTTCGGGEQSPLIRVLVVDDDKLVREIAVAVIDADPRFSVVATATSVREAIRALGWGGIDVVLLDHDLPDGNAALVIAVLLDTEMVPVLLHTARADATVVAAELSVPVRRKGGDWGALLSELARVSGLPA